MASKVLAVSSEVLNPLDLAQSKILGIADESFRTNLMEALIDSLTIDRNSGQAPFQPQEDSGRL